MKCRKLWLICAACLALLTAAPATSSAKDADELRVLDPASESPPAKLLYELLRSEVHAALDRRLEEYEAIAGPADLTAYRDRRRRFFVRQLGGFPERTPLNAQVVGELQGDGYRIQKVIFESQPNHHVPALMYLPQTEPPYPCVLVSSGHSRTGKVADYNQRFGIIMARHGMAALCYDPIGQGERSQNLDQQGRPAHESTTFEHFQIGVGSILLGTNTARYRIWDGIRAIDYVTSREDIMPERIGFTGLSGGGTLTSYVMALDDRVYCAAPACYLTTFRRLVDTIGPQDAEQNIFGQIAFRMDHPDYVLMRIPKPTLISATTEDFFDIDGTWNNFRQAKRVYTRLGYPERVDLVEGDGGHGVPHNNLVAIMRWMRRWLLEKDDLPAVDEMPVHDADDLQCTPGGQVLLLPEELSVFDLNGQWQKRLAARRAEYWREAQPDAARAKVRELAGIRKASDLPEARVRGMGSVERDDFRIDKLLIEVDGSVPLPALLFVPGQVNEGAYLYLEGKGKEAAAAAGGPVERLAKQGHLVLAVDLPALGEMRPEGADGPLGAWKDFYMAYLLGKSLVGIRAEAAIQAAQVLHFASASPDANADAEQPGADRPVHLIATGEATIPALHAAATSDVFASVHLPDGIPSWADVVSRRETNNELVGTVHGALAFYDLDDLARLHGRVTADVPPGEDVSFSTQNDVSLRLRPTGADDPDDTTALQQAIDREGGTMRLEERTYRITRPIVIDLDKVGPLSIHGDGVARVVMAGPGPAFRFVGTHFKSAAPEGFAPEVWQRQRMPLVDGVAIVGAHPEADGIEAVGTMQLTISRVHIRGVRHGIRLLENNRNVIISDCHIYENRGIGIYYDDVNLHQSNITGCHISYNAQGGIVARAGNVRNIHITGCDLESNMSSDSPPTANVLIDCRDSEYGTGEVAITGCTIQHNNPSPGSANIRMLGRSNDKDGEPVREGNVTITGNVLSDVKVNVHLQGCRGVAISGNTFWQGYEQNLLVEDCLSIVVGPNNFDRNPRYDYGNTQEANNAIVLRNCRDCTLTGLHVTGVWREPAGIVLEDCRRMNLTGCTILDCDNAGLLLRNVRDSRVSGCLIRDDRADSQSVSLQIEGGSGNLIADNLLGSAANIDQDATPATGNVRP